MKIESVLPPVICKHTGTNSFFVILRFKQIDKKNNTATYIECLPGLEDPEFLTSRYKYLIEMTDFPSFKKDFTVETNTFKSSYRILEKVGYEVDFREGTGFVKDSAFFFTNCPCCNFELSYRHNEYDIKDFCENCNFSFKISISEHHPKCWLLHKLKIQAYREDEDFQYYLTAKNSAAKHFAPRFSKFSPEQKRFLNSLLYFEKNVVPEVDRRINLFQNASSSFPDLVTHSGYLIELASLIYLTNRAMKKFDLNWSPHLDEELSLYMFAANHVRHIDELEPELFEISARYQSTSSNNKFFGMDDWEYRNFKSLRNKFGIPLSERREVVIKHLYNFLVARDFKKILINKIKVFFEAQEPKLCLEGTIGLFKW